MKCPVCGMAVDEKKATAKSTYKGTQYVFCGQDCKDAFDKTPERYIGAREPMKTAR
jgi:YHS domain-containing protein